MLELLLTLIGTFSAIGVSLYAIYELKRTQRSLLDLLPSLDDFIFEKDGEWQVDERLVKVFDLVGSRIALSMRQSLFQGMGVEKKIQGGLQKAVIEDVIDGGALGPIGGLADMFLGGKVKDYLTKNPSAINYLLPMIQQFAGNIKLPAGPSKRTSEDRGFELR